MKPALARHATSAKTSPVRSHLIWSPASQCEQEAAANSPPPRVPAPAVVVSAHRPVSPLVEPDSTQAYQIGGRCWSVPPPPPPPAPISRLPSRRSEHGERSFQVRKCNNILFRLLCFLRIHILIYFFLLFNSASSAASHSNVPPLYPRTC